MIFIQIWFYKIFIINRKSQKMSLLTSLHLYCQNKLSKQIQVFLYRENHLSPLLFFSLYFLKSFEVFPLTWQINNVLLLVALLGAFIFCFNPYFLYVCMLYFDNPISRIISIILGLCSINEHFKIILVLFTLPSAFFRLSEFYTQTMQLLIAVVSCWLIYYQLLLNSITEIKVHYTGFSLIALLNVMKIAEDFFEMDTGLRFKGTIIIIFAFYSYNFIVGRIQQIKFCWVFELKNPKEVILKIQMIREDLEHCAFQFLQHQQFCLNPECFCKEVSGKKDDYKWNIPQQIKRELINNIFLQYLSNTTKSGSSFQRNYFQEELIKFYLENNQPIKALTIAKNNFLGENYFMKVLRWRVWEKIRASIFASHYFLRNNPKFRKIFMYDLNANILKSEIYGILGKKILFWDELSQKEPYASKLQLYGSQVIDQMQKLHEMVNKKILPLEQETLNYDCTFLYAGFLILTTNFTQYADQLLKNINRSIMETEIQATKCTSGIQVQMKGEVQRDNSLSYNLIITNISSSLAESLNKQKNSIINEDLDILIPEYFRESHHIRFNQWVKSPKLQNGHSEFINHYREIPFRVNKSTILFTGFKVRLYVSHLKNQFNFQGILLTSGIQSNTFLATLDGQITYRESLIPEDIITDIQIQNTLQQIKSQYSTNLTIKPREQLIETDKASYYVKYTLFMQASMKDRPIVKVKCQDENLKKVKFVKDHRDFRVNHRNNNIAETMSSVSTDFQNSMESQMTDTIIKILDRKEVKLSEINCFNFCGILIIISSLLMLLSYYYIFLQHQILEPMDCVNKISQLQNYQLEGFIINLNRKLYQRNDTQYRRLLEKAVDTSDFMEKKSAKLADLSQKMQDIYLQHLMGSNERNFVSSWIQTNYQKQLQIEFTKPSYPHQITFLTIQQIMARSITQLRYFDEYPYQDTIMSSLFTHQNMEYFHGLNIQVQNLFHEELQRIQRMNYFRTLFFLGYILIVSLICLKIINIFKDSNKKIYNLFISLNSSLLVEEIDHFQSIRNKIVFTNSSSNLSQYIPRGITCKINRKCSKDTKNSSSFNFNTKIRVRSGQIMTEGSSIDKKRLNFCQVLFFALQMLLIVFVIWTLAIKNQQNSKEVETMKQVFFLKNEISELTLEFYQAYLLFDGDLQNPQSDFIDPDIEEHMRLSVEEFFNKQSQRKNGFQETQILTCNDDSLICKQNHSYPILRGIIKKSIYDTYNMRYASLLKENQTSQYDKKVISGELFLAEQAMEKLSDISEQLIENRKNQLKEYQIEMQLRTEKIILIFGVCFLPLLSISFICKSIFMKNDYMRNLMLLTFLNKQMIFQNKRIYSFINKITKKLK